MVPAIALKIAYTGLMLVTAAELLGGGGGGGGADAGAGADGTDFCEVDEGVVLRSLTSKAGKVFEYPTPNQTPVKTVVGGLLTGLLGVGIGEGRCCHSDSTHDNRFPRARGWRTSSPDVSFLNFKITIPPSPTLLSQWCCLSCYAHVCCCG